MPYESYLGYLYFVNDAPEKMMSRELACWFHRMNVWDRVLFLDAGERDEAAQYNSMVRLALATSHEHFVFCDADIRPHMEHMVPFWTAKQDVVGARYTTENAQAWSRPDVMHAGLWRTDRGVLEAALALGGPLFEWEYDEAHERVTKCLCRHFCDKVKAAGFTVGVAGEADHRPRKDFCGRVLSRETPLPA